jgi:hypothetical protein
VQSFFQHDFYALVIEVKAVLNALHAALQGIFDSRLACAWVET